MALRPSPIYASALLRSCIGPGIGPVLIRSCIGSPIIFIDAYLNEVTLSHSMWSVELRFAELFCFTFLRNSDVDQSTQLNRLHHFVTDNLKRM